MHYLSVIAIFKNETMNLKIWLDHYIWQGVEHFYLIDNDSDDNPMNILKEYIDNGYVTYHFGPEKHIQDSHIRFIFDKYELKLRTYWLLYCDLDEFAFGINQKLVKCLNQLEGYNVIYMNWLMFGSNGYIAHPYDIRTALTYREPNFHELTKYIIKTDFLTDSSQINIHNVSYNDQRYIYNSTSDNLLRMNHYPIQSEEFFKKVKMSRGDATSSNNVRDMNYFNSYNKNTDFRDEILKNLIVNPSIKYNEEFINIYKDLDLYYYKTFNKDFNNYSLLDMKIHYKFNNENENRIYNQESFEKHYPELNLEVYYRENKDLEKYDNMLLRIHYHTYGKNESYRKIN